MEQMPFCKRCQSESVVKDGVVRKRKRFRCNDCGYNFIENDAKINTMLPTKKALAVILYSLGKASFNMTGRIFGINAPLLFIR
ncbi:MAG: hypothetical protein LBS77_05505 [Desulfovibrio sp.]|jgi:transposase-like protein|nr:hypothetical protein [Desulfovibrio sp.]